MSDTDPKPEAADFPLKRLLEIMARLRSEGGCPWDAEQTPESLRPYLVEETYEVLEAIDRGDPRAIRDELGDLLLQIVFQARIFEERGEFSMTDVIDAIAAKLVRRHPHVFADTPVGDSRTLEVQWDAIKAGENLRQGKTTRPLDDLPRHLPALQTAQKILRKTRPGEGAPRAEEILDHIAAQLRTLAEGIRQNRTQALPSRFGELLFTLVGLAEVRDIAAEDVLRQTNRFFIDRHHAGQPETFHEE